MFRKFYVLHRWFGIAGGLMVLIWHTTGLYVHWRALPSTFSEQEQTRALGAAFSVSTPAKDFPDILWSAADTGHPIREVRLRRAGSRLVYEVQRTAAPVVVVDAQSAQELSPISEPLARDIAQQLAPAASVTASTLLQKPDRYAINLSMPVYRVTLSDGAGTTLAYVDPGKATIVARARARERMYYLFGSIPHFLNFNIAVLRSMPTVKYTLLFIFDTLAALIALTGIIISMSLLVRHGFLGGIGRRSFSWRKWHYLAGLCFSVTTLLFVVSAFWYVLDGSPPPGRVRPRPDELESIVQPIEVKLSALLGAKSIAQDVTSAPVTTVVLKRILDVPLYAFQRADGSERAVRADTGTPLVIDEKWVRNVANKFVGQPVCTGEIEYLTAYDTYYYSRNDRRPPLPVYRVQCSDPGKTLLYLAAATGEVVGRADRNFRVFRWVISGFHAWDWPWLLRRPLLWNLVVIILVAGGTVISVTGLYLGVAHLARRANG